jgi:transcriptional regulator with XRE-family HTH domain
MNSEIGTLIRDARLRAGVSQASLARRAGTSQAAVSRIERGLEQPSPERIEALLASLGLRMRIELEPIAEHYANVGQLLDEGRKSPGIRLQGAVNTQAFLRELRPRHKRAA